MIIDDVWDLKIVDTCGSSVLARGNQYHLHVHGRYVVRVILCNGDGTTKHVSPKKLVGEVLVLNSSDVTPESKYSLCYISLNNKVSLAPLPKKEYRLYILENLEKEYFESPMDIKDLLRLIEL